MKNKVAVISDVHGNLEALKKVIVDINSRGIEHIICLGDTIGKGTHPNECVDLIREHCSIVLRGNTDRYFTQKNDLEGTSDMNKKRVIWNKNQLTEENKTYLQQLPFCHEMYISGSLIRLFHATPINDDYIVTNTDSFTIKKQMFYPSKYTVSEKIADIVIYGHIHYQYLDNLFNKTLINAGSVGNSLSIIRDSYFDSSVLETVRAQYVIVEGDFNSRKYDENVSFQFIRTPYSIKKELSDIEKNIEPHDYKYELENGMYRDMKKIKKYLEGRDKER